MGNEKVLLHKELEEKSKILGKKDIVLTSFILSKTPYNKLVEGRPAPPGKEAYIAGHVLFLDDAGWPDLLFKAISQGSKPKA